MPLPPPGSLVEDTESEGPSRVSDSPTHDTPTSSWSDEGDIAPPLLIDEESDEEDGEMGDRDHEGPLGTSSPSNGDDKWTPWSKTQDITAKIKKQCAARDILLSTLKSQGLTPWNLRQLYRGYDASRPLVSVEDFEAAQLWIAEAVGHTSTREEMATTLGVGINLPPPQMRPAQASHIWDWEVMSDTSARLVGSYPYSAAPPDDADRNPIIVSLNGAGPSKLVAYGKKSDSRVIPDTDSGYMLGMRKRKGDCHTPPVYI
jgi:hypothetical protein